MFRKESFYKVFLGLFIFICGLFIGFLGGEIERKIQPAEDVDMSIFWHVYNKLEDRFIYFNEAEKEEIVLGATKGMVDAFGDPHTMFFDPQRSKDMEERLKGKFEGVGMEVGLREGEVRVISPIPNTPAERAGMLPGDVIIYVDEVSVEGMSIEEVVSIIRGPKGEPVTLTILRGEEELKVIIIRDVINVPSLSWDLIEKDIVHLKLYYFHEGMSSEFSLAANAIAESSAKGIIIDLRNNPGGSLDVVQDISGWFLDKGSVVALAYDKEKEYLSRGNPLFDEYPLVVIINEGSASASEIMASALRDNRGITIVGKQSFGKGSIQSLEKIHGGSSLKITVSEFFSPNGEVINNVGVFPDIEVDYTIEDREEERDPQLEKAIDVLKEKIK